MKKTGFILLTVLLAVASCKTTTPATGATVPVDDTISDYSFHKIMRDKELYAATKEMVPLDTAYITQDTLHILTQRILGCDAGNFKLMWNGAMLKSLPPQTNVKLFEQVEPDCKEMHRFHLTYNIKPLQFKRDSAMFSRDSCAAKTTMLHIGNYKRVIPYGY